MSTFANFNCGSSYRSCISGCCNTNGTCATTAQTCTYPYTDLYTNTTKYYYPGYANTRCSSTAKNCSTGCCKSTYSCATDSSNCMYEYTDLYTNPSKYYLPPAPTTTNSTSTTDQRGMVGGLAGGISGGVVFLIVMIVLIIQCCRRKAKEQARANNPFYKNNTNLNGSTIIMTNNTPQPVYGMNQPPMAPMMPTLPPMQPMMQPAYSQPINAGYDPMMMPPTYNQGMPSMTMGFGQLPQPGPILY